MKHWSLFLHFYQPTSQDLRITNHVLKACYLPVLNLLLDHPESRFSFNINSSLLLQLKELGKTEFFEKISTLVQRGQIELFNSPVHHPLAPLVSRETLQRQLDQDQEISQLFLGTTTTQGIFFPELAITPELLDFASDAYRICLIDESSVNLDFDHHSLPQQPAYKYKNIFLPVASRALGEALRSFPQWINPEKIVSFVEDKTRDQNIAISANDVELFGHHYEERIYVLKDLLENKSIQFIRLTEVAEQLQGKKIGLNEFYPSSWQTTKTELRDQQPFAKWLKKENPLQKKYYELLSLAQDSLSTIEKPADDVGLVYNSAENHYDSGTASCYLYWLSNEPWWHPDLVEIGLQHLIKTIRTLPLSNKDKLHAESLYSSMIREMWQYHWSEKVTENFRRYKKQRQILLADLPDLK